MGGDRLCCWLFGSFICDYEWLFFIFLINVKIWILLFINIPSLAWWVTFYFFGHFEGLFCSNWALDQLFRLIAGRDTFPDRCFTHSCFAIDTRRLVGLRSIARCLFHRNSLSRWSCWVLLAPWRVNFWARWLWSSKNLRLLFDVCLWSCKNFWLLFNWDACFYLDVDWRWLNFLEGPYRALTTLTFGYSLLNWFFLPIHWSSKMITCKIFYVLRGLNLLKISRISFCFWMLNCICNGGFGLYKSKSSFRSNGQCFLWCFWCLKWRRLTFLPRNFCKSLFNLRLLNFIYQRFLHLCWFWLCFYFINIQKFSLINYGAWFTQRWVRVVPRVYHLCVTIWVLSNFISRTWSLIDSIRMILRSHSFTLIWIFSLTVTISPDSCRLDSCSQRWLRPGIFGLCLTHDGVSPNLINFL